MWIINANFVSESYQVFLISVFNTLITSCSLDIFYSLKMFEAHTPGIELVNIIKFYCHKLVFEHMKL